MEQTQWHKNKHVNVNEPAGDPARQEASEDDDDDGDVTVPQV